MPHKKNEVIEDESVLNIKNLEINPSEKDKKETNEDIPQFKEKIEFEESQIIRLRTEVFNQWNNLIEQRKAERRESKWDDMDAQYEGEMEDNTDSEFTLNVPVTKVKEDSVVRLSTKAFLESDPKYTVMARPETIKEGREPVADRQESYLDYLFDEEIELRIPLRQSLVSSSRYDVGIMKIPYVYKTRKRKREEEYSGKKEKDAQTQEITQPGLKAFLESFPGADKEGHEGFADYNRLKAGNDIQINVEFDEVVYNNPKPDYVDIRNFWIDSSVNSYEDMCDARITVEQQEYTYWELKKLEAEGDFENVDEVLFKKEKTSNDPNPDMFKGKELAKKKFKIIEVNYWFDIDDDKDIENEVRVVCWFNVDNKAFLGANYYPYFYVDCIYIPFWIKDKKSGFYKGGLAEDLTDSNLAQNAILNFMLTGAYIQNTITPIVREGSTIAQQFIEKRWTHGVPIEVPNTSQSLTSDLDFVQKPNVEHGELLNILLFLSKMDDDQTGISSLKTGRESPQDPRAPASKVALLLKETGINIQDYIDALVPSFNKIGEICLMLIYQMSKSGRIFRQRRRANKVVGRSEDGKSIFDTIQPDEMVTKTNIQSQASTFAFDKEKEKADNLALYQVLRGEAAVFGNPSAIYQLVRALIESWGPLWKNRVDLVWPTPEQFNKNQLLVATEALQLYLAQIAQQRQNTGVDPQINMDDFLKLAQQMQVAQLTPQVLEEGKKNANSDTA